MRVLRERLPTFRALRRVPDAEDDEEEGTISADVSDDDLHADLNDLKRALATFPYGDVKELSIALYDNRDQASTLLDDNPTLSCQIFIAFECALEAYDIDALSLLIGLCAVLFRIDWSDNAEFIQKGCGLIVELLQCPQALLGEVWPDALDILCYAITSDKIADPEIIGCAIASQTQFLGPEADASFDDRMRACEFLETIANHPMACFDDSQNDLILAFVEHAFGEEEELQE
jgi:hypothetical protein